MRQTWSLPSWSLWLPPKKHIITIVLSATKKGRTGRRVGNQGGRTDQEVQGCGGWKDQVNVCCVQGYRGHSSKASGRVIPRGPVLQCSDQEFPAQCDLSSDASPLHWTLLMPVGPTTLVYGTSPTGPLNGGLPQGIGLGAALPTPWSGWDPAVHSAHCKPVCGKPQPYTVWPQLQGRVRVASQWICKAVWEPLSTE